MTLCLWLHANHYNSSITYTLMLSVKCTRETSWKYSDIKWLCCHQTDVKCPKTYVIRVIIICSSYEYRRMVKSRCSGDKLISIFLYGCLLKNYTHLFACQIDLNKIIG